MLTVSKLFIYPIKSLGGISVSAATITDRGFQYDRRWMLVDLNNRFITQRENQQMVFLQMQLTDEGLQVRHKTNGEILKIPASPQTDEKAVSVIFDDRCETQFVDKNADEWFSKMLSVSCRLVYMPDSTRRIMDEKYVKNQEITSLSDSCPILIIGQSTLDDLNSKLVEALPVNRFRPNIVFTGGQPFDEDEMQHFTINEINFYSIKPCGRCIITTINQENSIKGQEPLKTLASYRTKNNKVLFGHYLLGKGDGTVNVGDAINIRELKDDKAGLP